ncbi:AAA family ATPase [Flammeovirga yaeyamensis]|uniref:AAA family ATPase n=1 Tax=Flammeovirga yaeyamensis TaxID=367791 RepID=A0AAX1NAC0_9BACT|nr:AAA family ATPase [Flammeovirga yaeyamensis]QWG04486.1 AAA family ATPase [Flammeovirga yaeyamensis]
MKNNNPMLADIQTNPSQLELNKRLTNFKELLHHVIYNPYESKENIFEKMTPFEHDSNLKSIVMDNGLGLYDELFLLFTYSWKYHAEYFIPLIKELKELENKIEYNGVFDEKLGVYIPTVKTFLKLFVSEEQSVEVFKYLTNKDHFFIKQGVIYLTTDTSGVIKYLLYATPQISQTYVEFLNGTTQPRLDHELDFPAKLIQPTLTFDQVILPEKTQTSLHSLEQMMELRSRLTSHQFDQLKIKKSTIVVFSGAPGTGKSITATTLGEKYNMPTYTLELSKVVSRYIGEFEKSMDKVFYRLDGQNVILLIDEADAIFAKRSTDVKDTRDKYANQEMSYLLQRIERYNGIMILTTNVSDIRKHIDKAMLRRVELIIDFPFPLYAERKQLWSLSLPQGYEYKEGVVDHIAENYQLNGSNISNIASSLMVECILQDKKEISLEEVLPKIQHELYKRSAKFTECKDSSHTAIEQRTGGGVLSGLGSRLNF